MSTAGLQALPTQWSFAEESAAKHGNTVDRKDWRIVLSWHIAESREQARVECRDGLLRWHNEYNVGTLMRPGVEAFETADQAVDELAWADGATSVIGTPDDLVARLRDLLELTGGFGTVISFVHDWTNREAMLRSYDLVARYVVPELNGLLAPYRESRQFVVENRGVFERAGQAVMAKIMENERAAEALKEGANAPTAIAPHHAPDMAKKA